MKPHPHLRSLAALAAILMPAGSLHAASVLFVDTTTVHSSWNTLITGAGHTYTVFDTATHNVNLSAQSAKDYVNSFDVVVVSGSNAAFNALRANGANWNPIETPLIILGNYLISGQYSSSSWQWTTPGTGTTPNLSGTTDNSLDVLAPADPIWSGITLTLGTPSTSPDLFSANAGALTVGTNSLRPGITPIATKTSTPGTIAVAYAAPDALASGGGARYFIPGFTGGDGQAEPFTADGEKLFLNAINVLAVPEPSAALVGSLGLLVLLRRRRD